MQVRNDMLSQTVLPLGGMHPSDTRACSSGRYVKHERPGSPDNNDMGSCSLEPFVDVVIVYTNKVDACAALKTSEMHVPDSEA